MDSATLPPIPLDRRAYTVGWITVINKEFVAAIAMLDNVHPSPEIPRDPYSYATGRIAEHNVAITCSGEAGPSPASHCAAQMMRSFPNIKIGLLCGIGGAVPSEKHDIRLGDVVVSKPGQGYGGVAWYDPGKLTETGFKPLGHLNRPPLFMCNAVERMEAERALKRDTKFSEILAAAEAAGVASKNGLQDQLYDASNLSKPIARCPRSSESGPAIHYGTIASGSWVIKTSGSKRNDLLLNIDADVLCFEMEAAGLMNDFPCLVVRGMSDYCDSHKNDEWQSYASMTAACYCKWLLYVIKPRDSIDLVYETTPSHCQKANSSSESPIERKALISREPGQMQRTGNDPHSWPRIISQISDYDQDIVQERLCFARVDSTTDWFLERDEFQQWSTTSKTSSLWCSGSLGSGKTIISSRVIDYLQRQTDPRRIPVFFFYFDAAYEKTTSISYAFKSLIKQQLEHMVVTNINCPMEIQNKINFFFKRRGPQPDWQDISRIFSDLFFLLPQASYVIDGLNEVHEESIRLIMILFQSLLKKGTAQKFFISSREELGWDLKLSLELRIHISFADTKEDLWRYIESEIASTTNFRRQLTKTPKVKSQIAQSLFKDAHGMFLWVRLQIEALRRDCKTDGEILQALQDLPPTLPAIYKRCLDRVPTSTAHLTSKVLRWVSCSLRALHIIELAEVVSLSLTNQRWDSSSIYSDDAIISCCANLVVLDGYDKCVRLTHPSVKQFLTKLDGICPREILLDLDRADTICGEECIEYLSMDDFKLQLQPRQQPLAVGHDSSYLLRNVPFGKFTNTLTSKLFTKTSGRPFEMQLPRPVPKPSEIDEYKFLQYAIDSWAAHSRNISRTSFTWDNFETLALKPSISWKIHPWVASGQSLNSHFHGLLIYACREHHIPLLKLLFEREPYLRLKEFCNIPSSGKDGLNALQISARLGFADIVSMLLPICDVNFESPNSQPALFYAIEKNQLQAARTLLQAKGVKLTTKSPPRNAFVYAYLCEDSKMVTLISELHPGQRLKGKDVRREFLLAAETGRKGFIRAVFEHRIHIDAETINNALESVATRRHCDIVKLLIEESGLPSHLLDPSKDELLREAAERGDIELVKLMAQQSDIDINSRGTFGWTALHKAATQGHGAVVQMLLQQPGINVNSKTHLEQTALCHAAREGHGAVVQMLLQQPDIDVTSKDGSGRTARSFAAKRRQEGVVKLIEVWLSQQGETDFT